MATPKVCDWPMVKRLARYLLGRTRAVLQYAYQHSQDCINTWTDTDFAGCRNERKSTSGGLIMHGTHCLKSWSSTQSVIAGSSGEAEYDGIVKGGSNSLGMRSLMSDLGINVRIQIKSDASAAIGIASRRGLGNIRHLEVSQLWLQQRVASEDLKIEKVKGAENVADALTKHLGVEDMKMHMDGVGLEHRSGRHNLMPEVAKDGDDEKYIVMGTAEREEDEDEYLAVISFGSGMEKGLEPVDREVKHSKFVGIFSTELVIIPRGGSSGGSCLNNDLKTEYFRRREKRR